MQQEICGLTNCAVSQEGGKLKLGFRNADGDDASLVVSVEQAGSILMTLPNLIEQALRARHADPSLRFVFPLGDWTLETAPDPNVLILNLKTSDGFAISFAVPKTLTENLAAALDGAAYMNPRLNKH